MRCLFFIALFTLIVSPAIAQDVSVPEPLPKTVIIEAGEFLKGSSKQHRQYAYNLDELAYNHNLTRKQSWYSGEFPPHRVELDYDYEITRTPITQQQYKAFIEDTGYGAPHVSESVWRSYGLVHPYTRASRFLWKAGEYPEDTGEHPVVLLSHKDARAYADWLSQKTGGTWRLPTEEEWEKAARGTDGRLFPWGNKWNPNLLNSHDNGPFTTMDVGSFPKGASPYGVMDAAGQVYEWTATKIKGDQENRRSRYIVKGGSWDDKGCGVCRPAARHARPARIKHILIGFRLVKETQ